MPNRLPRQPLLTDDTVQSSAFVAGDAVAVNVEALTLRHGGLALAAADRTALLQRVRAGEVVELEVDLIGYIQRSTPHANHWRFKKARLKAIAKSFGGKPFLRDHGQWSLEDRGGTIQTCRAEGEGDETSFGFTVRAVKPWAVEGFLDGTIDRFSIGAIPTGPIECSRHKADVRECDCWPGMLDDKGNPIEWVLTDAEGVEVSAVNVPAVSGTRIQDIRTLALSLGLRRAPDPGARPHQDRKATTMDRTKLCQILGLAADSTDEQIEAAIRLRDNELGLAQARATRAESDLAPIAARVTALEASTEESEVTATIAALYGEFRLRHSHAADGTAVIDPVETALRGFHRSLGIATFRQKVVELRALPAIAAPPAASAALISSSYAATVPVPGAVTAASPNPPIVAAGVQSPDERRATVTAMVASNPELRRLMAGMGCSVEDVVKYGPKNLHAISIAHPEAAERIRQGA